MKVFNKTNLILVAATLAFNSCAGLMGMMGGMGSLMGGGGSGSIPGINVPTYQGLTGDEADGMMLSSSGSVSGKIGYVAAASSPKDTGDNEKIYGLFVK